MSSLAQMVIRLVAEARQYKADLSDAAQHTQKVAADMAQSTGKVQQAAAALGDQLGVQSDLSQKAGAAVAQMGAAHGSATGAVGALAAATGVAAAAVVILGVAYIKGRQEVDAYNRALILSGNVAGTTSGQLDAMAAKIAKVSGTQSAAAAALAEMAQASGVGRDNLEEFTRAAIRFETTTGTAVSETAKKFHELAKSPLAASLKLNETYNYLTESVYRQIKSLEDQGKTTEAANVAQKALADTLDVKTAQMFQNLGLLEKAWMSVKGAVLGTWDAVKGVGRADTVESQIAALEKQITGAGALAELARSRGMNVGNESSPELLSLKAQLSTLKGIAFQRDEMAKQDADRQAKIDAISKFDKDGVKYLSDQLKMKKEIQAVEELGRVGEIDSLKVQERIQAIRDSYKKKTPKADPNREIDEEIAALKAGEAAKAEVVKQGLDTIASERKRGVISESDALQQTVALQLQALADKRSTVEAELALSEKKKGSQKEQAVLQGQIAALEAQQRTVAIKYGNDYFEMLSKGNLAAAEAHLKYIHTLEQGLAKMQQEVDKQNEHNERLGLSKQAVAALDAEKLNSQAVTLELMAIKQLDKNLDEEQYRLYKAQAKALRDLASAKQTGAAKEAGIEAEKAIAEEAKRTAETIERTLTDSLMRGFESGKGFARNLYDSTVNLFKTMVLRPIIQAGVSGVFGLSSAQAVGSGAGGSASGVGGLLSGGSTLANLFPTLAAGMSQFSTAALASTQSLIGLTGTAAQAQAAVTGGLANMTGASTLATSLGTAVPYIAAAVAVYSIAKSLEGGEKRSGATYTTGSQGEALFNQGPSGGEIAADQSRTLFASTQTTINSLLAGFGSAARVSGFTAGLESSNNGKGFQFAGGYVGGKAFGENLGRTGGQFTMQSQDEGTALANYATDLQRSVLQALQAADLGGTVGKWVNSLGDLEALGKDQITTSLAQISAYQQLIAASKGWPDSLGRFSALTVEASASLLELTGGIAGLTGQLGSYLQNFYSDAERAALVTKQVGAEMGALGLSMPTTRDDFRKLVEAQDLTTDAGRKNYAMLLKVSDAFAGVVPAADSAINSIASVRQSWQDQLDVLTGKTTDTAQQLKRDLASTTDESTKAIIRQVYAEKERKKAIEDQTAAQVSAIAKLTSAYSNNLAAQKSAIQSQLDAAGSVKALLDSLQVGTNASTSPQSRLDAARSQYLADLSKAKAGDYDAYSRVANTAQTYIGAGADMYASSADQKAIIAQVQSELGNLPAVAKYDENLAALKRIEAAITASAVNTVDAINSDKVDTLQAIHAMALSVTSGFDTMDVNSNGMLTFEELKAGLGVGDRLTQQLINAVDTNGDGQISKLELIASNTGGLAELDKINKTINQFNWADSNKPAAIAGFGNIAKQNNWSVAQIAAASGYSTAEISKLFAGTGIGTGVGGTGTTSATSTATTATAAPNYAVIAGIVNSLNWDTASKASSATALYGLSLASGWTQQMISSATGHSYPSIQSLFASAGIPNFETGGNHMGGLRLVGERGPELEVTGPSRIFSASQTAAMLGSGSKEDLKPTLKQVTALLERLLAHQAAANNTAIAKQERIAQATELTANATKLEGARA